MVASLDVALRLWRSGSHREALKEAAAAHAQTPHSIDLLNLLAAIHASLQEPRAVVEYLRHVTRLMPRDAAAHLRLADAEFRAGDTAGSISSYRRSLELEWRNSEAQGNLGVLLEQQGDSSGAAACYRSALALDESNVLAHYNLGNVLLRSGDPGEAYAHYQRAIALRPDFAAAWCNSAGVLLQMRRPADAVACSDRALALNAGFAEAWHMRGAALRELGRTEEALHCAERAIALRKDYAEAIYARASLLRSSGDRAGAVAGFGEVRKLNPRLEEARMAAVVAQIPIMPSTREESAASRPAFAAALADLGADLCQHPCSDATALVGAMQPFHLAYQDEDQRELLGTYGRLCTTVMGDWQRSAQLAPPSLQGGKARLRVGFVSAHINAHSVYTAVTRGWLRRLDPRRFEVNVLHLGAQADAETSAARNLVTNFVQGHRTVREWARTIIDRRPDVLIYPEVGMDQTTLQLASMRLAPLQVAFWGHPMTTGLPSVDCYISAERFEPADGSSHYTERLVKFPNLGVYYEPPEAMPPTAQAEALDRSAGPVLVCAGTPFKYAPEHDAVLVAIARRLGRCQFHFFSYQDGALSRRLVNRLNDAFAAAGLDGASYLRLRAWASPIEFHAALSSADLLLDTIGFSGFNTVMHALACTLPVVTCRGRFMRGRLGSGILEQLSLAELVADNPEHYADIVVRLAEDPGARTRIRAAIEERLPQAYRDESTVAALEKFLLSGG